MTDPSDDGWMTADDLAAALGITRRHLDRVAARAQIEGRKKPVDRRTWYPRQAFEEALATRRGVLSLVRAKAAVSQPRADGRFGTEPTRPQ